MAYLKLLAVVPFAVRSLNHKFTPLEDNIAPELEGLEGYDFSDQTLPPIQDVAQAQTLAHFNQLHGPNGKDAELMGAELAQAFKEIRDELPQPVKVKKHVRWVHVPKCGSSFGGPLYRFACGRDPNKNWTVGAQFASGDPKPGPPCDRWVEYNKQTPFGSQKGYDDLEQAVPFAMLREPLKRHISAVEYANCKWNLCAPGFQARFVLGIGWQNGRAAAEGDAAAAIQKIRNDFAFVGLADDWDVSMMLFHAMFGTQLKPDDMMNARNTNYNRTTYVALSQKLQEEHWNDPYDVPLVQEVEKIMKERITERFGSVCKKKPDNLVCSRLRAFLERGDAPNGA